MRREVIWIAMLMFFITLCGCGKKPGEALPGATPGEAATGQSDEQLAAQLKPAEVTPSKPLDQGSPHATLAGFFESLMIALDPAFQAADKQEDLEPNRAQAYREALTRLRKIFVERDPASQFDPNTEVVAYLDLIRIKKAEIVGEAVVTGNEAKVQVKVFKGIEADRDPMSFGETTPAEAVVEVLLVKVGEDWRIKDFGGLVVRARANLPVQ